MATNNSLKAGSRHGNHGDLPKIVAPQKHLTPTMSHQETHLSISTDARNTISQKTVRGTPTLIKSSVCRCEPCCGTSSHRPSLFLRAVTLSFYSMSRLEMHRLRSRSPFSTLLEEKHNFDNFLQDVRNKLTHNLDGRIVLGCAPVARAGSSPRFLHDLWHRHNDSCRPPVLGIASRLHLDSLPLVSTVDVASSQSRPSTEVLSHRRFVEHTAQCSTSRHLAA